MRIDREKLIKEIKEGPFDMGDGVMRNCLYINHCVVPSVQIPSGDFAIPLVPYRTREKVLHDVIVAITWEFEHDRLLEEFKNKICV